MSRNAFILLLALSFALLPAFMMADEAKPSAAESAPAVSAPEYPVNGESVVSLWSRKLMRGLTNAATGLGEIPRQMIIASSQEPAWVAVPAGFFSGIFMSVARTAYGALEAGTFIVPLEGTYNSLLKPAYVWGPYEDDVKHVPAK